MDDITFTDADQKLREALLEFVSEYEVANDKDDEERLVRDFLLHARNEYSAERALEAAQSPAQKLRLLQDLLFQINVTISELEDREGWQFKLKADDRVHLREIVKINRIWPPDLVDIARDNVAEFDEDDQTDVDNEDGVNDNNGNNGIDNEDGDDTKEID